MTSCPSQRTACACSVWRDLARLGELTRLKPFTWEKVGSPPRVTLSCQPSDPTPRARFAVSRVNGRRLFISNCRKRWLAPQGHYILPLSDPTPRVTLPPEPGLQLSEKLARPGWLGGGGGASGPRATISPYNQGLSETSAWILHTSYKSAFLWNGPSCASYRLWRCPFLQYIQDLYINIYRY